MKNLLQTLATLLLFFSCLELNDKGDEEGSDTASCFEITNNTLMSYNCSESNITIPSGVVAISENALKDSGISSIVFPDSLRRIGRGALQGNDLEDIEIPATVEEIGENAFADNDRMDLVHIPHENPRVGENAFPGHFIWGGTRDECFIMETAADGVSIAEYKDADDQSQDCPDEVAIPKGVKIIKRRAFANEQIQDIKIPVTVEEIGEEAFAGNPQMDLVHVPHPNPRVGTDAFPGEYVWGGTRGRCFVMEVISGGGVAISEYKNIDDDDENCPDDVEIPKGITEIKQRAFANKQIMEIDIPDTVEDIGEEAFAGNNQMKMPHIPHESPRVGTGAFPGQYVWGGTRDDCFMMEEQNGEVIITGYRESDSKQNTCPRDVQIPQGVTVVEENAFANDGLTDVEIPDSVTDIKDNAFAGNTDIETIHVPNPIANIGAGALPGTVLTGGTRTSCFTFDPNDRMTITGYKVADPRRRPCPKDIIIPLGVTQIAAQAFQSKALTAAFIPRGVTQIGASAFASNALVIIALPDSLTSIGNSAFASNPRLTLTHVPSASTTIGTDAFGTPYIQGGTTADCFTWTAVARAITITACNDTDLLSTACPKALTIPSGTTAIGNNACKDKTLTSVTIPSSVTSIGTNAFTGNSLTAITLPTCTTYTSGHATDNTFDATTTVTQTTCPDLMAR